jgi:hypothetical protein
MMTTIEAEEEALGRGQWVVGAEGEILPFMAIIREWQSFVLLQESPGACLVDAGSGVNAP